MLSYLFVLYILCPSPLFLDPIIALVAKSHGPSLAQPLSIPWVDFVSYPSFILDPLPLLRSGPSQKAMTIILITTITWVIVVLGGVASAPGITVACLATYMPRQTKTIINCSRIEKRLRIGLG